MQLDQNVVITHAHSAVRAVVDYFAVYNLDLVQQSVYAKPPKWNQSLGIVLLLCLCHLGFLDLFDVKAQLKAPGFALV